MEKANPSTTAAATTITESRKHSRQPVPKVPSTIAADRSRSDHRRRPGSVHADLLLLRELDELRHLSIGSPVPTPGSSEVDDPLTPSSCVPAGEEGDEDGTTVEHPGASGFPLIKVDGCSEGGGGGGGSLPGPVTTGSGDGGGDAMRQNKSARRNSDTLATPCHVPRSFGSRVVRYKSFSGSEENVVSD